MSDRKPLPLLLIKGRKAERKGRKKNGREGGKKTQEKNFYLWRFQWVIGEGNGNPLQYSCLENSVDRAAWWAAIYGVTQSRTQLKQLSNKQQQQQ